MNHGNVEFNEEPPKQVVAIDDSDSESDDEAGEAAAIRVGQQEMENSDDEADLKPGQARLAISNYIKMNNDTLKDDPFSFLSVFQKLTKDEEKTKTAMVFVQTNNSTGLKKFISNI